MALSQGIYRLLPWTSSIGGNKVMAEMLVTPNQHQSPVLGPTPVLPTTMKRKRDEGDDNNNHHLLTALAEVPPTKRRLTNTDAPSVDNSHTTLEQSAPEQNPNNNHPLSSTSTGPNETIEESNRSGTDSQEVPQQDKQTPKPKKMDIDALRQSVDAQLSLEVLLKHDELRLIDQEIAKCQVALEQLRRCAEIPYPASAVSGLSQLVSSGVGHAIPYLGSGPPPTSPSPWGVVDGPYSRHYAKWLLPDPRFDGGESPPAANYAYSTRGSAADHGHAAGKTTRAQRGAVSTRLQALPSGYPPPKDKAGPMIIKRKSDNQLVKLVCIDCRRYDFSSTQGFINHCRIAHSRTFASHEAAAEACGESVDVDEAGAVVGGAPEPSTSTAVPGYVHPLIRSAPAIDRTPKDNKSKQSSTPQNPPVQRNTAAVGTTPRRRTIPGVSNSSFVASPAAPHLSSFLADMGSGLNLGEIVGDAKTTVDMSTCMSESESSESDDEGDGVTPVTEDRPLAGARLPARTTMPQAASQRPTSSKGHEAARSHNIATPSRTATYVSPYPPSTTPGPLNLDEAHAMDPMDITENLSPHTVESNQAPSLVSDDEDEFEAASDSESINLSASEGGHEDEEIDDIEVEDDEGTATPTATESKSDVMTSLKRGHGKKGDRILAPAIVSLNRGKEGRRVNFVKGSSPTKSKKDPNSKQG